MKNLSSWWQATHSMYHHHRMQMPLAKIYTFSNGVAAFLVEADSSACELSLLQNPVLHHLVYRQGLKTRKHSKHINIVLSGTTYSFSQRMVTQDIFKRSQSTWNAQGQKNCRTFPVMHLCLSKVVDPCIGHNLFVSRLIGSAKLIHTYSSCNTGTETIFVRSV